MRTSLLFVIIFSRELAKERKNLRRIHLESVKGGRLAGIWEELGEGIGELTCI